MLGHHLIDALPRQNLETLDIWITLDNLKGPIAGCHHPVSQSAWVAASGLDST